MPVNGYTVGRDVTITIITPLGAVATWEQVTSFSKKQDTVDVKVKRMDGVVDHLMMPDGWSGSIALSRGSSDVDAYFATLETSYYNGVDIGSGSIVETITETDGSVSQFTYTGVMLKLSEGGTASGEAEVKQQIDWVGSRRKQTA